MFNCILGTISKDIEQMVKLYLHGLTYETVKTSQSLAKVQVPFGQVNNSVICKYGTGVTGPYPGCV